MQRLLRAAAFIGLSFCAVNIADAGPKDFKTGPVFDDFGKTAAVETDFATPVLAKIKVSFDVAKAAKPGEMNRSFDSAARFVNMHVAAGMKEKNVKAAIVVHGPASFDLISDARYRNENNGAKNGTAPLISALTKQGVRVILCGQTAAYRNLDKSDLLPGIEIALSAMTAHTVLQNQGYTLNPF